MTEADTNSSGFNLGNFLGHAANFVGNVLTGAATVISAPVSFISPTLGASLGNALSPGTPFTPGDYTPNTEGSVNFLPQETLSGMGYTAKDEFLSPFSRNPVFPAKKTEEPAGPERLATLKKAPGKDENSSVVDPLNVLENPLTPEVDPVNNPAAESFRSVFKTGDAFIDNATEAENLTVEELAEYTDKLLMLDKKYNDDLDNMMYAEGVDLVEYSNVSTLYNTGPNAKFVALKDAKTAYEADPTEDNLTSWRMATVDASAGAVRTTKLFDAGNTKTASRRSYATSLRNEYSDARLKYDKMTGNKLLGFSSMDDVPEALAQRAGQVARLADQMLDTDPEMAMNQYQRANDLMQAAITEHRKLAGQRIGQGIFELNRDGTNRTPNWTMITTLATVLSPFAIYALRSEQQAKIDKDNRKYLAEEKEKDRQFEMDKLNTRLNAELEMAGMADAAAAPAAVGRSAPVTISGRTQSA